MSNAAIIFGVVFGIIIGIITFFKDEEPKDKDDDYFLGV